MQIISFNPPNLNKLQNTAFRGHAPQHRDNKYSVDTFSQTEKNIKSIELTKNNCLKGVTFKRPLSIVEAVNTLAETDDGFLNDELLASLHNYWNLVTMKQNLKTVKELSDIKVTKLIGIGSNALVFETTDGLALKVTDFEQFPNGRKTTKYDLPLLLRGNAKDTGYYLEEKTDHESLTQEELRAFVNEMLDDGCELEDYLVDSMYITDEQEQEIKKGQFGRAKDGKIYLTDPGCMLKGPKEPSRLDVLKDKLNSIYNSVKESRKKG